MADAYSRATARAVRYRAVCVSKYAYAAIAGMALFLDILIHVNRISAGIDTGTVATVGNIAIAVAASSLALAGITGQANAQSGKLNDLVGQQTAQSAKLDTITDQTNGKLHSNVVAAVEAAVAPAVRDAVSTILPVPVPVPTVVMGTPVPAAGLPPIPVQPAIPLNTEGKPQ